MRDLLSQNVLGITLDGRPLILPFKPCVGIVHMHGSKRLDGENETVSRDAARGREKETLQGGQLHRGSWFGTVPIVQRYTVPSYKKCDSPCSFSQASWKILTISLLASSTDETYVRGKASVRVHPA